MPAWVPNNRGARPRPYPNCVLRSPRSNGRFELGTIAMPDDMGPFDVERLKKLVTHGRPSPLGLVKQFDEVVCDAHGVACVARTTVTERDAAFARVLQDTIKDVFREDRPALQHLLSATAVRRDWYVACRSEMANIWYRGATCDAVAADLVECEAMVRSIRFESARPQTA